VFGGNSGGAFMHAAVRRTAPARSVITGFSISSIGAVAAVVAHGIVKESAVPPKEIDRAIERKRRFEANPAKHGREESTK